MYHSSHLAADDVNTVPDPVVDTLKRMYSTYVIAQSTYKEATLSQILVKFDPQHAVTRQSAFLAAPQRTVY